MGQLLLLRHAETAWNAADRIQGSTDIELGERGLEQAEALGRNFVALGLHRVPVVTSPLLRAAQTAKVLAAHLASEVAEDERFTQRNFGVWQGMQLEAIQAKFPEEHVRYRIGSDPNVEGYEKDADVAHRAVAALDELAGQDAVIVTHGSVIRAALYALLDLPWSPDLLGRLANGEYSVVSWRESRGWTLARHAVPLVEEGEV